MMVGGSSTSATRAIAISRRPIVAESQNGIFDPIASSFAMGFSFLGLSETRRTAGSTQAGDRKGGGKDTLPIETSGLSNSIVVTRLSFLKRRSTAARRESR